MHPVIGIQEKQRFDGRLRFYRYPECTIKKLFQRLMCFIKRSLGKDENGNIVVTKLESASMQKMANQTGGKYLEINTVSGSFNELITQLEQITANVTNERRVDVIENKYFYFLIIALFLLGIDVFFTVRTFQL